jgi:hypothetical protein
MRVYVYLQKSALVMPRQDKEIFDLQLDISAVGIFALFIDML